MPTRRETTAARRRSGQTESRDSFTNPAVAVDVAVLSVVERQLVVLLHQRTNEPYLGEWALPGVFVRAGERLDWLRRGARSQRAALDRALDKVNVKRPHHAEQLFTWDTPNRDPRGWVISVGYFSLVEYSRIAASSRADEIALATVEVPWRGEEGGPVRLRVDGRLISLAFDHASILGEVVKRVRGKLRYSPIGYHLLPREFTLTELRAVHETLLARELNKDSFRRTMLASGDLEPTGDRQEDVGHRPGELYRFQSPG